MVFVYTKVRAVTLLEEPFSENNMVDLYIKDGDSI